MQYLLIDFGASFIKCCKFDKNTNQISSTISITSPFTKSETISKQELLDIILNILNIYPECKYIISCSILGGEWINDIYYSWKVLKKQSKPDCLISQLFIDQKTYHIHQHHGGDINNIIPLGCLNDHIFYSSLGDTNCVIECMNIQDQEYVINIGTGSQVITKNTINKYIPAGRALLVFAKFFNEINIDIFDLMKSIKIEDIVKSSLNIDLNVFEQSHKYSGGGGIFNINENSFTLNNLLSSILKTLVIQYKEYILFDHYTIILSGGIPQKLPFIKDIFEYYYTNPIVLHKTNFETLTGLTKFILKI